MLYIDSIRSLKIKLFSDEKYQKMNYDVFIITMLKDL